MAVDPDSARILPSLAGGSMLTTRLCAGSVVPMEDRALTLSLATALRDLRDDHPQVHAGVLNLQGAVYRTIVVDGLRQYRALRVCFGRLGYSHRWGDTRNLAFFKPRRTGSGYFLTTVEPL